MHEALSRLKRYPGWIVIIAVLSALLSAFGSWLQVRWNLGGDQLTEPLLRMVAILPLEIYFLPRLMAGLDAEALNRPENPWQQWSERFEERWLRAFAARMLLYLLCGLGLTLCIVPGLVVLLLFGWAPHRVLLRGDGVLQGFRWSLHLMARQWPAALRAALGPLLIYTALLLGLALGLQVLVPDLTPWQRLTHPTVWVIQSLAGLLDLWLTAFFLSLYQAMEKRAPDTDARASKG